MLEKVSELNRSGLRMKLENMLSDFSQLADGKDIEQYVRIRNMLVHEARFLRKGERGVDLSEQGQYFFMHSLVGRIILALLGYDGNFYNWTSHQPGDLAGPDAKGRERIIK